MCVPPPVFTLECDHAPEFLNVQSRIHLVAYQHHGSVLAENALVSRVLGTTARSNGELEQAAWL